MKPSGLAIVPLVLAVSSTALADPPPPRPQSEPTLHPYWSQPVVVKTHSTKLMGGGIALTSIGTLSIVGGAWTISDALSGGGHSGGAVFFFVGLPLLIHGVGCLAAGIPMIAIGSKKITVKPSEDTGAPTPVGMFTPRSAALSWSF